MAKPFKVFGIGLNKTGTSSLKIALRRLGYDHAPREMRLVTNYYNGKMAPIFEYSELHESFEDWPWPLVYKEIYARYGDNARYILTARKSTDVWLKSIKSHSERVKGRDIRRKIYGYPYPHGVEKNYAAVYENHNAEVREFFTVEPRKHLFADLCWEQGDGYLELCRLLGEPLLSMDFPHNNNAKKSNPNSDLVRENANKIREQLQSVNGDI